MARPLDLDLVIERNDFTIRAKPHFPISQHDPLVFYKHVSR